jgi:hypothetical protein
MVGVRNAELMDTSVEPLNHFYFTDEINEVPGIGNLASRYTRKKQQAATRLMAPVLQEEEEIEETEMPSARAFSSCTSSRYFLMTVMLVLLMSRQYAILSALIAAAWASYAVVYA